MCFWTIGIVELKLVFTDAEADLSLSIVGIIPAAAGEESTISVWFYPERYSRGVMKNKSLKGQVLHLSVEPKSSVVSWIWIVLLALITFSTSP